MPDLTDYRKTIDHIDTEILNLLEQRMACVEQIIQYKKTNQLPVLDSNREQAVLDAISRKITHPNYENTILATFRDIMRHSRDYQNQLLEP